MTLSYADGVAEGMDVEAGSEPAHPGVPLEMSRDNSVLFRTGKFTSTIKGAMFHNGV